MYFDTTEREGMPAPRGGRLASVGSGAGAQGDPPPQGGGTVVPLGGVRRVVLAAVAAAAAVVLLVGPVSAVSASGASVAGSSHSARTLGTWI